MQDQLQRRLQTIKAISFTHKTTDLCNIGKLHIDVDNRKERLSALLEFGANEVQYISTCNRVEILLVDNREYTNSVLQDFFTAFNPNWTPEDVIWACANCKVRVGEQAVEHVFRIASSLDSLVVGEREIITQVRKSFDECNSLGLTGDYLRVLTNKTIECAKEVYTHTNISKNPISVVSLAYRALRDLNLKEDSRVLVVGAGETNTTMCKFLYKHGFKNITVVNRTFEKAKVLAEQVKGECVALVNLDQIQKGFDLLVTCTGSESPIFTRSVYEKLLIGEETKKTIVDLAIPTDVDSEVIRDFSINYIDINSLKKVSDKNLKERELEVHKCEFYIANKLEEFRTVFQERKIEIAMKGIPLKVKEIRETATNEVFQKELDALDANSREVLDKMLAYMEKKYISVPMVMAKDILLKES